MVLSLQVRTMPMPNQEIWHQPCEIWHEARFNGV